MADTNRRSPFRNPACWAVPAALIALSLVPAAGGAARLVSLATGAVFMPDSGRFFADPLPAIVHIVSATLFSLLVPRLRANLHAAQKNSQ